MNTKWADFNKPDFIKKLKDHDEEAWDELVAEKTNEIKALVEKGLYDKSQSRSIVNGGFARAYESIDTFDEEKGSLRNWIYKIVHNQRNDELEQELSLHSRIDSATIIEELPGSNVEGLPEHAVLVEIEEEFNSLDLKERQILEDMMSNIKDEAIAMRDGITEAAVRQRRSRAIKNFWQIHRSGKESGR